MLGDYWGIDRIKDKYIDDDKGTCVLMVQTDKAVSLCNMQCIEVSYDEAQQNVMNSRYTYLLNVHYFGLN